MYDLLDVFLRLFSALVAGSIIGATRERINRPAGLRTHALISLGSAFISFLSLQIFSGPGGGDPGRVAAQIVSGIGFLGAGTILKQGLSVKGLTTAATLWVTAAIGMGFGSGQYLVSLVGTGMVLGIVLFLKPISFLLHSGARSLHIHLENRPGLVEELTEELTKWFEAHHLLYNGLHFELEGELLSVTLFVDRKNRQALEKILPSLMAFKGVKNVEFQG
ncbi:MAG TPA: MgtC/SapB family protein [Thermotogota bacterium]|nr:MgtC/SapB family protein [Thermotogota bacterium]HRW92360.1 MgtC/SapB family protein [Thermotogota bacterium]